MNASWSLWFKLWQYSPEFGNPTAFCTHLSESKVEAFTITLQDGGENLYRYLREQIGKDSSLAIPDSNWSLSIYPCQHRIGPEEWPKTYTIWGYGLTPERHGNYIQKPMCRCAGQEILSELISHLGPGFDGALSTSITIPRLIPLASASLMRRNRADRPQTIPKRVKNIGLIGMFSEVADETVCGVEYGIRTAQTAVYGLMGLHLSLPKVGINAVAEKYGSRE
jgi:oleate hydratase